MASAASRGDAKAAVKAVTATGWTQLPLELFPKRYSTVQPWWQDRGVLSLMIAWLLLLLFDGTGHSTCACCTM